MILTLRYFVSFTLLIFALFKAESSGAQPSLLSKTVTIRIENQPVNIALQQLSKQTSVHFSYNPDLLPANKRVNINVVNRTLGDILSIILGDAGLSFQEVGSQLVIYQVKTRPVVPEPASDPSRQNKNTQVVPQIPDTIYLHRTDTLVIVKTDTLVKTSTVIQHDTIVHTDTVFIEKNKTQKAGKSVLPNFERNSLRNQKFREHNGLYGGVSLGYYFGKPHFSNASTAKEALFSSVSKAYSASYLNHTLGLIIGYDYPRLGVQTGIQLTRLGESFNYSFSQQIGGYYKTDTVEQYYTLSGIDTTWYYVTDSSWVNIDYKKYSFKNPNSYRYLEIPFSVKIRFLKKNNFEIYASAGVIAGLLVTKNSLYIRDSEDQNVEWLKSDNLNMLLFSWQAGLGASVDLSAGTCLFMEACYRDQFNSQFKDYPFNKKFQLLNVKTGIFVRL